MSTLGQAACIITCPMEASLTSTSFPANTIFRQSGMYPIAALLYAISALDGYTSFDYADVLII